MPDVLTPIYLCLMKNLQDLNMKHFIKANIVFITQESCVESNCLYCSLWSKKVQPK